MNQFDMLWTNLIFFGPN